MRKFHHNKVLNILTGVIVYSSVTLIITCSLMILFNVIVNGPPTSFGIYG